jgi:hypothetical protein
VSVRDGILDERVVLNYSDRLVNVLRLLMHPDPSQRPSAQHCIDELLPQSYQGPNRGSIFRGSFPRDEAMYQANREVFNSSLIEKDQAILQLKEENARLKKMINQLGVRTEDIVH